MEGSSRSNNARCVVPPYRGYNLMRLWGKCSMEECLRSSQLFFPYDSKANNGG